MKHLRYVLAFLTVAALLVSFSTEADAQKKKQKKGKAFVGKVLKIETSDEGGTLVIMTNAKKKKGKVISEGKEMTFKLTKATKVVRLGKKKTPPTVLAMTDVKTGSRVRVIVTAENTDTAVAIQLFKQKKKKKAS